MYVGTFTDKNEQISFRTVLCARKTDTATISCIYDTFYPKTIFRKIQYDYRGWGVVRLPAFPGIPTLLAECTTPANVDQIVTFGGVRVKTGNTAARLLFLVTLRHTINPSVFGASSNLVLRFRDTDNKSLP